MPHIFIRDNDTSIHMYDVRCIICNIKGFNAITLIKLYSYRNNLLTNNPDDITCDEFIIKNIIE